MTLRPLLHILRVACLAVATLPALAAPDLAAVVDGPQRSAANRARDPARHPLETLAFFGLAPGQTVIEIAPGGGWYTEILAPYLRETAGSTRPTTPPTIRAPRPAPPARVSPTSSPPPPRCTTAWCSARCPSRRSPTSARAAAPTSC